ncbi:MAG: helix-turn-helix transcriptional regulator [Clostridia bacterium]|nr:helix-turn-helix transcriptional regulator [Clostridia bacterium]
MKEKICCDERHQTQMHQADIPAVSEVEEMSKLFSLLGDPARLKILFTLFGGERCVCDIQANTGAMQSATSHHLRLLKDNHVLKARREGKSVFYSLDDHHIYSIIELALTHIREGQ